MKNILIAVLASLLVVGLGLFIWQSTQQKQLAPSGVPTLVNPQGESNDESDDEGDESDDEDDESDED